MKDISKIILYLYSIKFNEIINLGTGRKIHLKKIARIIANKYKKRFILKIIKNPLTLLQMLESLKNL